MTPGKRELLKRVITLAEVERLGGPGSGGAREGAGRPPNAEVKSNYNYPKPHAVYVAKVTNQ